MSEHDWWTSSFCSLKIFLFVFSHNNVDTTYIFGCKIGTHSRHDDWSLAALLLLYHQPARFTQPNTIDILTSSLFVVPTGSQKILPRRGFKVLKKRSLWMRLRKKVLEPKVSNTINKSMFWCFLPRSAGSTGGRSWQRWRRRAGAGWWSSAAGPRCSAQTTGGQSRWDQEISWRMWF